MVKESAKQAQPTLGIFSEPSYISIGDPYDPPREVGGRNRGLNIMTQNVKKGAIPCGSQGVTFERQFKRISEGDLYLEPGALERKWRKEAWNKCRTTDGFTYPSPSKHRTGLGDTSGNFNQIHNKKHDWPTFMPRGGNEKKTKQDILNQPNYPAPRNILTSPVKRGSYGYTTKNYLGKGSEFSYVSDPYSRPREMEMEERKAFKEKTAIFGQGRPFNTASHALDCYDKDVYVDPPQLRGGYLPSPSNKDKLAGKEPFRPSQPGKTLTAKDGCFSPFTKAIPGNAAEEVKTTEHKVERAVFIPSSPEKTMRQTSIMFRSAHQ